MTADAIDRDLQRRLRSGDRSVLAAIHDRYAVALHGYARSLLHADAADDAVQDVFVAIAERRELVAQAADLASYLLRMVRNRALDLVRRRGPLVRAFAAGDQPLAAADASAADDGTAPRLAHALAQLPDEQREVVSLKIWSGLTFAAIADVLDIPANTAASRYRYAIAKLHTLLDEPHDA
jgi:RNA polymerase sigma-70 factor, ECF subfamily